MVSTVNCPVNPASDRSHNILGYPHRQPLDAIFKPNNVAVIGATEKAGSVGRTLLWNLISTSFGGAVFPINPKRSSVLGIKAYLSIADVPEPVDLAVIATPAPTVPGVLEECVAAGVKGAIVISAGFKEIGPVGIELERRTLEVARRGKIRVVGPNCLGLMNPQYGLNATFASTMAMPGNVGFISQSGALCTSILDWSFRENVGFSAFISIGSMLDVNWGDLIYYLGDDPHTNSIVIYMESIGDARQFLSAAREVALSKPIIVIKAGRTEAAAKAAASHTGSLTGSDGVLDAAFRRAGVLRVDTIDDLFNMAEILAKQPRPKGRRLTILTNAGGPGVLATDTLIRGGGELAPLSPETHEQLNACLPAAWSHHNPIDILGDADPKRYKEAMSIVAQDANSDGLLVILTPQAMTEPIEIAKALSQYGHIKGKPVLASWMGGQTVAAGEVLLNQAGIYTFPFPDTAAQVFNLMCRYSYSLQALYETPSFLEEEGVDRSQASALLEQVRASGRTLLTEYESKQLLAAYGIPIVETRIATSCEAAVAAAEAIGYPVVLKLHSETITHKTDVGGVQLNLRSAEAVESAFQSIQSGVSASDFLGVTVQPMLSLDGYELILGSSIDPQFGPVLLFGCGGQLVEVFKDRALALPPLNTTLARRAIEQTKIYKALQGVRGRAPVDLAALEELLVRFSQLVVEQPWIKELDINPLLAKPGDQPHNLVALDARVVLHPLDTAVEDLPRTAIRPYPNQYVSQWAFKGQLPVTLRPIRPDDEPLVVKFHEGLSEESVYLRYAHMMKLSYRTSHDRLSRICFTDYDQQMVLVAEHLNPDTGEHKILGIGRLTKLHGTEEAEFAVLVQDEYQRGGLGTQIVQTLVHIARQEGVVLLFAEILRENSAMQRICDRLGFKLTPGIEQEMLRAELMLV
jgi:acetyltransferase